MKRADITAEILRELVQYDNETGLILWRPRSRHWFPTDRSWKIWNARFPGKEAFIHLNRGGVMEGRLFGVSFYAHQIAWMYTHGKLPADGKILIHLDGNKTNNRLNNLKEVEAGRSPNRRVTGSVRREQITVKVLKDLLSYDPETGSLTWKFVSNLPLFTSHAETVWNKQCAGQPAFTTRDSAGYLKGQILTKSFLAHRVAWAIFYDQEPPKYLDHIDGCRSNNRISNLRAATISQNGCNKKPQRGVTSEYKGVCWDNTKQRWRAGIKHLGRAYGLGYYEDELEAAQAYDAAARRLHGRFARPNFKESI